jgi:hypothetical protein
VEYLVTPCPGCMDYLVTHCPGWNLIKLHPFQVVILFSYHKANYVIVEDLVTPCPGCYLVKLTKSYISGVSGYTLSRLLFW